jgi:hypothetical protein
MTTLHRNLPLLSGLPFAAAWVVLTDLTGSTYHLAPLLAAAAPGLVIAQRAALPRAAVGRAVVAGCAGSALACAANRGDGD